MGFLKLLPKLLLVSFRSAQVSCGPAEFILQPQFLKFGLLDFVLLLKQHRLHFEILVSKLPQQQFNQVNLSVDVVEVQLGCLVPVPLQQVENLQLVVSHYSLTLHSHVLLQMLDASICLLHQLVYAIVCLRSQLSQLTH